MKFFRQLPALAFGLVTFSALAGEVAAPSATGPANPTGPKAQQDPLAAWQATRFGLFIHWGPVALKGTEISWSRGAERRGGFDRLRGDEMPVEVYDNLYKEFDPVQFNAGEWVAIAQAAGMKYVVLVTRHHDGFSLFDTHMSDYKITSPLSPFRRDIVKELADAAHQAGLKLGFYYSQPDWHHPDAFTPDRNDRYLAYLKAQLRELLTNYGRVDILWYDGLNQPAAAYDGLALNRLARELQPQILINNRNGEREQPEDFDILEQRIGKYQDTRPWESCITICRQWSWKPNDPMKSLAQCLTTLVTCAGGDGNLLLNVGPMPDGRIEPRQVDRLREMGAWLAQNGESIYGTRGGPWKPTAAFASTRKDRTVFLHLLREDDGRVELPALARRVRAAKLFAGGAVKFEEAGGKLQLAFDAAAITPIDTIIQLELDGSAMDLPAISPETVPAH